VQEAHSNSRTGRWVGGSLNRRTNQRMGGWDSGESIGVGSPGAWSGVTSTTTPYSPYAGSQAPGSTTFSPGLTLASAYGQWFPPTAAPATGMAGFPASPPTSTSPYMPQVNPSASGGSSNSTHLVAQVPILPRPGSPYAPQLVAGPGAGESYGTRSGSGLNPNRSTSQPNASTMPSEKKEP
jgi:hypothetical protein